MNVALAHWQDRISPVFDVARNLLTVKVEDGREVRRDEMLLGEDDLLERASQVSRLGVDVLICGAISWPLEMALFAAGVGIVAQTCGNVEDVLTAFVTGKLTDGAFLMPGCHGRQRCRRARRGARRRRGGRPE